MMIEHPQDRAADEYNQDARETTPWLREEERCVTARLRESDSQFSTFERFGSDR